MNEKLDPGLNKPAYLCGRLLAIYDALQYQAQGELNMTVADRYYSLASINPMAAFPRVDDLGQKHLRKLRRDKRGVMIAVEREIQQIHKMLADECGARFPGPLNLEDQGRFAIGFHHQRAESMARAASRKHEAHEDAQPDKES